MEEQQQILTLPLLFEVLFLNEKLVQLRENDDVANFCADDE
jgi:hypothetical protein